LRLSCDSPPSCSLTQRLVSKLTVCLLDLRPTLYKHVLHTYSEYDPGHPEDDVVTADHLKGYFGHFGALLGTDRQTRQAFKNFLFDHFNVGVNCSLAAPQDLEAIKILGWGAFQTYHIDAHLTDEFPLVAFMAVLSNTHRLKHLYITAFTGLSKNVLPTIEEDGDDVEAFLVDRSVYLGRNLLQIEDINIDLVCEQSIAPFLPYFSKFIQQAWMNMLYDSEGKLTWWIKRGLFLARPTLRLSTASDEQTYSNRGLEDVFN
jgi:hypothetical protein